jgi:ABC-type antimicrobial peptide transport system permease subunit
MPERMMAALASVFGIAGAVLAALGLYGLMAFMVTQRTREIALRMACGATRGDALMMVMKNAVMLAVVGIACGVPIILAAQRLAGTVVTLPARSGPGVPFFVSVSIVIVVAIAASYFPARRAARVEPMQALRHD